MATNAPSTFSESEVIRQLRTSWGGSLEGATLSWAGSGDISYYIGGTPYLLSNSAEAPYKTAMTSLMVSRATLAFELWDDLISRNLTLTSVAGNNEIQFEYASQTFNGNNVLSTGGGTYARPFGSTNGTNVYGTTNYAISREEIWLNSNWTSHDQDSDMYFGGYGFQTYMHEIGHSLGLSHPGSYNAGNNPITYIPYAEYAQDNRQYTIMSYFGGYLPGVGWQLDGTSSSYLYSSTPMVDDIAAIQAIYGADTTTRRGDTVYGFNCNLASTDPERDIYDFTRDSRPIFTIWDAGVNDTDTLDCSGYGGAQTINLNPGSYSSVDGLVNNIGIAYNCIIENAVGGAGNDIFILSGANVNNLINGNGGSDIVNVTYGYGSGYVIQSGSTATNLVMLGSAGADTLQNIEYVHFTDGPTVTTASLLGLGSNFATPNLELAAFGYGAGSWSSDDQYPRMLADVNGDGKADIVGFGYAGAIVSLATGNGHFAAPTLELGAFGYGAGSWSSDDKYPRELADVNGDGKADIVGFGYAGVYVSLATGSGHFANPTFELSAFAYGAGSWSSDDKYPRELADVNGDGKADIVGFGYAGTYVSLATGGGHFANPTFELAAFGYGAGSWSSDDQYPRMLGDVNGDGKADIVGFGYAGAIVSLATGNGHFAATTLELAAFGYGAGSWSSDDKYPRELADVNGDGKADIIGFGYAGAYVSLATGGGHFANPTFELSAFAYGAGSWSADDKYPREVADVTGDGKADIVGFGYAGVITSVSGWLV